MDTVLQAGPLCLRLRPGWGGRVMSFVHATGGDILLPITEARFEPEDWPRAGAYPLVPFHNRVEGARFRFSGREALLHAHPASLPHALHGMGSRMCWTVRSQTEQSADLLLYRPADSIWPWRFEARQVFVLDAQGLTLTLHLLNKDIIPMPGGVGWHPYLPRPRRILDDARFGWPIRNDYLPGPGPVPREDLNGDTLYLMEWESVTLDLPDGLHLRFRRQHGLRHLVIHQPPGPFACVEPVSHLVNALTQPKVPDMGPLAPGATLTARFRLDITC